MNNFIYRQPMLPLLSFGYFNIFEELVHLTPIYSIIPNKRICIIINSIVLHQGILILLKPQMN